MPVTWGYLILASLALLSLFRPIWHVHMPRFVAFLTLLPFQILSLVTILTNGYLYFSLTASFLIHFHFLPLLFYFAFSRVIETLDLVLFCRLFKQGMFWIALYGIALFIIKTVTGRFIEIPFLTTNFDDFGQLDKKHINRGLIFKLVSTYNNGNIFGVCQLLILPLYQYLETRKWPLFWVKTALILTFSRTIWFGLIFHELVQALFIKKKGTYLVVLSFFVLVLFSFFVIVLDFPLSFIFDPSLGRRTEAIEILNRLSLFSVEPFYGIHEMVYYWIFYAFGIFGLVTFLIPFFFPFVYQLIQKAPHPFQWAVSLGLLNYYFLCLADGAISLIPTMAFFWFLASLLFRKNETIPYDLVPKHSYPP